MKGFTILLSFFVVFCFLAASGFASDSPMKTVTGKVSHVDPRGKAIVVTVGSGKDMMDVGAIVGPDTILLVEGKNVPISGLAEMVKDGDMVTLHYIVTDNVYAKEIIKK